MSQSSHPERRDRLHGPKRRNDSARPTNTHQAGVRRPWPTVSTTRRIGPAKPVSTRASAGSHGSAAESVPVLVWTGGPAGIDLDAAWPTPIIKKIVEAFSKRGARVVLLPQPTSAAHHQLGPVGSDGVLRNPPEAAPDDEELTEVLTAIDSLDRTSRVVRIASRNNPTGPVPRPSRELVSDAIHAIESASTPPQSAIDSTMLDGADYVPANTDLVITSHRPEDGSDHASDLMAVVAAGLLRVDGVLTVLTHGDLVAGELIDVTGTVVAAAQNAGLLYRQRIVALHLPVRDGSFGTGAVADADDSADVQQMSTAGRAAMHGLPAPHQRIHSDVLVFARPRSGRRRPCRGTDQAGRPNPDHPAFWSPAQRSRSAPGPAVDPVPGRIPDLAISPVGAPNLGP